MGGEYGDGPGPDTRRTLRPRWSLLNFLLITAIIALSIMLVVLWQRIGPLEREVRRLRNEVGRLVVPDESEPYALRLETDSAYDWKWVVWLPERERYNVRLAIEGIPKSGLPTASRESVRVEGRGEQFTVRYRIRREPVDRFLSGSLTVGNRRRDQAGASLEWIEWRRRIIETRGVGRSARAGDPPRPFVLLRYRVSETAAGIPQIEDPSAGVMIWLEPL